MNQNRYVAPRKIREEADALFQKWKAIYDVENPVNYIPWEKYLKKNGSDKMKAHLKEREHYTDEGEYIP